MAKPLTLVIGRNDDEIRRAQSQIYSSNVLHNKLQSLIVPTVSGQTLLCGKASTEY